MDYIIGVDAGGTKTEAVAYSLSGAEIGKGYSGFGNPLLNYEEALKNIISAITLCMKETENIGKDGNCVFIYCGLAGVGGIDVTRVEKILGDKFNVEVKITSDAEIALAAILKGEDGILTISGTGSICYGKYKMKMERAGGWGHILGDEGSGYYIALQAFKRSVFEYDEGLKRSRLTEKILERLQIKNLNEITRFIYSSQKGDIAAIAPLVVELEAEGEQNAASILQEAGQELARVTIRVYKKLGFEEEVKIGISGSIVTKVKAVRIAFEKELGRYIEKFKIVDEDVSASKGGYYLAKKYLENGGVN